MDEISANLVASPINVVVQDRKNPNLLIVGNDLGVWVSIDAGAAWTRLKADLPTVPVHDLTIHPRENDLVLGTYGRGIFLGDITHLQELSTAVLDKPLHLFAVEPRTAYNFRAQGNFHLFGNAYIEVPNEPDALIVNYALRARDAAGARVTIADFKGTELAQLKGPAEAGLNRVPWNMRAGAAPAGGRGGRGGVAPRCRPVSTGSLSKSRGRRRRRSAGFASACGRTVSKRDGLECPGMCRDPKPRGRRRSSAAIAVALLVIAAISSHAQGPADVAAYRQLIDEYRAGRRVGDADISRLTSDPSLVGRIVEPTSGWSSVELTAAAMLHTDLGLLLVKKASQPDAGAHIDAATTLLRAAVERSSGQAEFARRWRGTVAGLLQAFGAAEIASNLTANGMKWLTRSEAQLRALAAVEKGITAEIQAAVAGPLSGPQPKRTPVVPLDARSELRVAARHFEDALAADPSCAEAALHLGRVKLLDGRDAEAERSLRVAAAGDTCRCATSR